MAVIYEPNELYVDEIRVGIRRDTTVVSNDVEIHEAIEKDRDSLAIIGPSVSMKQAAELASYFRVARPALGIIVIREFLDSDDLKIAIESGVRDVVPLGDLTELQRVISKSLRLTDEILSTLQLSESKRLATVVLFFGSKGGVGKTTIAVNTALALSQIGANKVCLLDLDLETGDVGIFLNATASNNLGNLSRGEQLLDPDSVKNLIVTVSKKLDVVLSPSDPIEADKIRTDRIKELIFEIRKNYDFVLVDTKASFTALNLSVMKMSDQIFTVIAPDLTAIKNAKITLKIFEELGLPRSKRKVILNMSRLHTGLKGSEIERMLSEEITFKIPAHKDATFALNTGWTLMDYRPNNPISKVLRTFAQTISESRTHVEVESVLLAPSLSEAGEIGGQE